MTKFEKDVLQALEQIKEALYALRVQPQIVFIPSGSPYGQPTPNPVINPVIPGTSGDPVGWPSGYPRITCGSANSKNSKDMNIQVY